MPYDINAALERLEKNLQNLDSAREQVENTVNASHKLRQIVRDYINSITEFRSDIQEWEKQLKQSQDNLSSKIQDIFTTLETSCDAISAKFKSSTNETLNKFSEQNVILGERVDELIILRKELKSAMSEIVTIKDTLAQLTMVFNRSKENQDQALSNIIGRVAELPVTVKGYTDGVAQQMDERHREFCKKIDDSITKTEIVIQKLDSLTEAYSNIQKTCDDIKTSVSDVNNMVATHYDSLSKSIKINRWIIIAGIIILVALHFMK